MAILALEKISFSYTDIDILKDVNLIINEYDRVGIVGKNGGGKTTLINLITNELKPDKGTIYIENNYTIGYLRQSSEYDFRDYSKIFTNSNSDLFEIQSKLNLKSNIKISNERLKNLSGGERTKLILSSILAKQPNILILDEPTNHLDMDTVDWLIDEIKNYIGTVLIVSHDRYFLNKTVNRIVEVEDTSLKDYLGNYDLYKQEKMLEIDQIKRKYEAHVNEEKKLNKEIDRLTTWANKGEKQSRRQGGMMSDSRIFGQQTKAQRRAMKVSRSAKNKVSRLKQLKKNSIEKPVDEPKIHYGFNAESIGSKVLVNALNLSKSFNDDVLFNNSDFCINKGEKVGLIGVNGAGKTTLIKMILGSTNFNGELKLSPKLKISYICQDIYDLDGDKNIFELANKFSKEKKEMFISNLVNMNIKKDVFNTKIKNLSMGERMRIKISEIIIDDYNLLLLDEPSNHLDIPNKNHLEKALKLFEGTVIIATHDRYLLKEVTDKLLVFKDKKITKLEYGYKRY